MDYLIKVSLYCQIVPSGLDQLNFHAQTGRVQGFKKPEIPFIKQL